MPTINPIGSDSGAYITVETAAQELGCETDGVLQLIDGGQVRVVAYDGIALVERRDIAQAWRQALLAGMCLAWCRLDHDNHGSGWGFAEDGALFREHRGPRFGSFSVGVLEYNDGRPSVVAADIEDDNRVVTSLSSGQLRQLATDALAAAEWIEESRVTGWTPTIPADLRRLRA